MPIHKKKSATGPRIARMPQGSLGQKDISVRGTSPKSNGVSATTSAVETTNKIKASLLLNHESLNLFQSISRYLVINTLAEFNCSVEHPRKPALEGEEVVAGGAWFEVRFTLDGYITVE